MDRESKMISRAELYNQVWEIPMMNLAKQYGLSDVGLAKICKKHNIPRPPRGYWMKLEAGMEPRKIPLPHGDPDMIIEITPSPRALNDSQVKESDLTEILAEKLPENRIVVFETLRNPHPLVKQSAGMLRWLEPNRQGLVEPPKKECLDIKVSKKSLGRALRIVDSLIKALEERGHKVSISGESTAVNISDISVRFGISEELISKRKEPKDHDLDGSYQFGHSRFYEERVPSGNLCLMINESSYYWRGTCQTKWRDLPSKKLEERLNNVVAGLLKVTSLKKERIRREEEEERQRIEMELKRDEEKRIRADKIKRIKEESERVSRLITNAENWRKSKLVREYIAAVEAHAATGDEPKIQGDLGAWLKWAKDQADRLDPFKPSPPSILDEKIEESQKEENQWNGFLSRNRR